MNDLPINKIIRLKNLTCIYCACDLAATFSSKEHVIGRRFVPRGMLAGQWNLLAHACVTCNNKKADLEDDVSAITMYYALLDKRGDIDLDFRREAQRKIGKSLSRRTKKTVGESVEKITAKVRMCDGALSISAIAPPQIDNARVYELARLHITAFFYWITFDEESGAGRFWVGGFYPILEAASPDWGNAVHVGFMKTVLEWEPRVLAGSASGYFKIALRRHPSEALWSWALEWNGSFRVIGLLGDQDAALRLLMTFPTLNMRTFVESPSKYLRYRIERRLNDADDVMFQWGNMRLM